MASTILSRTFSAVEDKRIVLSNSNFARLWSSGLGTTWSKIRIGCRISMADSGANLTSTPQFIMGICSGTTNIYMDATTTHFLGLRSTDTTWARSAGPPVSYNLANVITNPTFSKKVGVTVTNAIAGYDTGVHLVDCTTENRSALFVDITKGASFTMNYFSRLGATASDVDLATYLAQVVLASPTIANHGASASHTIAVDEATDGYFNAVNIGWDRTSPTIEISDLAVVKLA